jgi:hypothetical protein
MCCAHEPRSFFGSPDIGGLSHGRCHRGQCHDSALQSGDDEHDPASSLTRAELGANLGDGIHKAKAVNQWLETHPRFALLWLPTYGPRANPSERACGDVHDRCTRNHTRKRLRDVVRDVERHRCQNGPWRSKLSQLYEAPEVMAAVVRIAAEQQTGIAA